ncbi:MAG: tetratricopeptide repeat protein [Desulfobacteraceae bacterium]|nr:tetratricopeptide repeat protein [Desulfobacteraceae bacterium]
MFKLHNRNEFQVYAYSFGPDDPSIYRKEIRESCDKFTDIHAMSHQDAAKLIAQDGVDILIDLMGHTKNARLDIFAARPAPVQVTWLGYPGTSGAEFIDYILTDKVVSPREHAQYYSEQLVYLPHCYLLSDHQQGIWTPPPTRQEVGLPQDRFVFCSFNQAFKIEARLFDCWMSILRQLPDSVLWLSSPPESGERNMKRQAELRGIDSSRLLFTGKIPMKDQFLARLGLSDLVLDPWVYNGHTTTLDALWAGVPVVSLQGKTFASRVSSGMLTVIDLPELITYTHQDYEKLILRLATHPDELLRIRQKLSKNRLTTPLFDTPRFVKNLENAFREMWKVFMSGQAPRPIEVPDAMTRSYLPDYAPLPNINQSLSDAFQLQNSGQNGEALILYDKVLKQAENHADAWHLSGLAAYRMGNYEDAIARIRKAIELSPSSAMYHSNLSAVYYDMKRYEDVIASCQKALELNPQFADAHINMGLSLKHLGKPDQALSCYDNALQLRPDHAEIWFNRAVCLQALGHSQQAIESYNKAIALKPDYPSAYFNRGNVFLALGQQEDARDSYNSALKYRPDYIEAIVNKGVSFQNQEKFAEAETCYRQVIAIRGDYLAAYTNLAALLKRQEKFQDAADLYEKAAQLNPSDSALCSEAGECRLKLYQFEPALSWFRRAMSLNPDNDRGFSQIFHHYNIPAHGKNERSCPRSGCSYPKKTRLRKDHR